MFALELVAVSSQACVDERDQDVAGALGGGQALVKVGQPARVDQHVTLGQVGDGTVVPEIQGCGR